LIDELLANYKKPEDLIGENGLLKQITKRLVERALETAKWPITWGMASTPRWRARRETRAMARAGRRSRVSSGYYPSRFPAIGTVSQSREIHHANSIRRSQ
jgi:hypothetical protein